MKKYLLSLFTGLILFSSEVFADDKKSSLTIIPSEPSDSKYWSLIEAFESWDFSVDDIYLYAVYLIDLLSIIAVIASFIFILVWAFRYVISFWEDEAAQSAKKTIKNAILGLIVASLAYVIVDIIIRFITQ